MEELFIQTTHLPAVGVTVCPLWLQVFQNSKMIFSKFGVANQIGVKKDKLSSFPVRHLFL